jgi:hypothetical protein
MFQGLFKTTPSKIIDKVIYLIQGKLRPDYEGIELGIAEKMALRALSQSSAAEMRSILQLYRKTGDSTGLLSSMIITYNNHHEATAQKQAVQESPDVGTIQNTSMCAADNYD